MTDNSHDQELMDEFINESREVLGILQHCLLDFLAGPRPSLFEDFAQAIDRVMGAALTLGLEDLGNLARLGKELGYKSCQIDDIDRLLAVHGLLSQLCKVMSEMLVDIYRQRKSDEVVVKSLLSKLQKASKDLGDLRSTVKLK
jgi:chemotaxis protein histidine kinase CheA